MKHNASVIRKISSMMYIGQVTIYTKSRADLFEIPYNKQVTKQCTRITANNIVDGMKIL